MATRIVHIEIPGGSDTAGSRAFWAGLFGWNFAEVPGAPAEYFHTRINQAQGVAVSGNRHLLVHLAAKLDDADDAGVDVFHLEVGSDPALHWLRRRTGPAGSLCAEIHTGISSGCGRATAVRGS